MFLGYQNGKIAFVAETSQELENLPCVALDDIVETDERYVLVEGEYLTEQEVARKEKNRIQTLFMTRSDFFDGTIKAFGADEAELSEAISTVLSDKLSADEMKLAINNFKNALHFYRAHGLFELLSGVEIPLNGEVTIVVTSEQWDKFFDETDKKNPDAYMALMQAR